MSFTATSVPHLPPDLESFVAQMGHELVVGQVLLQRQPPGWTLRHCDDRARPAEQLRAVRCDQLRPLAQSTASGAFRPLKCAPNLVGGWQAQAQSPAELGTALNQLYPGFVADWHALRTQDPAPVTDFRAVAERQTGMYRIVAMLTAEQAARLVRVHCAPRFCLKHREWTVEGRAPEISAQKSMVPCLEPCAVILEFARKAVRLEQAEPVSMKLPAEEWETVRHALESVLEHPPAGLREADFSAPLNPRRVQWTLEKLLETGPDS